ncbi:hypothetical protein D3C85_743040 [compost metagenome]
MLPEGGRGGFKRLPVVGRELFADLLLACLGVGPRLRHAARRRFQAGGSVFQQAGLSLRLGGNVARGLGQRVADLQLAQGGLRAGLFPFFAKLGGHRGQRAGPGGQAFLVARGQRFLQPGVRLVQRAQQRLGLQAERGHRGFQRPLVVGGQLFVGVLLAGLGIGPGLRDAAGRAFQAGRHVFQQAGLRLRLGRDAAGGLGQCVADFLLAGRRLRAGLFPFLA